MSTTTAPAIHVGDLVVNIADRSVIGEVLATSTATGGLHPVTDLDTWDTGNGPKHTNSGKIPVRYATEGAPYEYWEDPENIYVVRPADRGAPAIHE